MGRYIDWPHVTGRYGNITGSTLGAGNVGSYWLTQAEAEVDGRLAPRYTVPFTGTIPELVKDLCIDLTYYKMTIRQKESEALGKYLDKRFADIIAGTIVIPEADTTGAASSGNEAWVANSYYSRFGNDDPVNWQVDPDQIDAEQDARG